MVKRQKKFFLKGEIQVKREFRRKNKFKKKMFFKNKFIEYLGNHNIDILYD